MLKYLNYQIYTNEVPDELSLGFTILGCNLHCKGCHSSHTWDINSKNVGTILDESTFEGIIDSQINVSCILFFGGEWEPEWLSHFLFMSQCIYNKKTALYTGHDLDFIYKLDKEYDFIRFLDYLKVGSYIEELGGLQSPTTNQRLYKLNREIVMEDKTHEFWKTI